MKALLVNNCPDDAGIGVYSNQLFAALRSLDQWTGQYRLHVPRIDRFCRNASRHFLLAPFGSSVAALTNLHFILNIPRGYEIYHLSSPGLAIAAVIEVFATPLLVDLVSTG